MELCLRPGGWLSALARLFAAEDPAPQSRAQARPEVNARAEKLLDAYGDLLLRYAYSYLHNMADAEEVLQDTLVQFLKTQVNSVNILFFSFFLVHRVFTDLL